jgi:DNA topoisomerase IA
LVKGDHLRSRSRILTTAGWMKVYGTKDPDQDKKAEEQDNQALPPARLEVFFTRPLKTAQAAHKPLTPAGQSRTQWRAA